MNNKRISTKRSLIILIIIFFAIFTTLLIIAIKVRSKYMIDELFTLTVLVIILIAIAALYLVNSIIRPILTVEKAFDTIDQVKDLQEYGKNKSLFVGKAIALVSKFTESSVRYHEAEYLKKQAEFSELQSQINPHFLYNTLETIRSHSLSYGADDVAKMAKALALFFRYSIDTKSTMVTISDELRNIKNYFIIQQYRFEDKFQLKISIDDNDESILSCLIPKLTIQPIIENSIHHGLETKVGHGKIEIRLVKTGTRVVVIVTDNGVGMNEIQLKALNKILSNPEDSSNNDIKSDSVGIALTNVNKRIKLYFGKEYGIIFRSLKNIGTDVEVTLPIINSESFNGDNTHET